LYKCAQIHLYICFNYFGNLIIYFRDINIKSALINKSQCVLKYESMPVSRWEICRRWPKNRGQKQSSIAFIHSKQSRKLGRSCFSWRFFAFHSTIFKLTVILLKIDHEFFVLWWFFFNRVIGWSEYCDVNMGANAVYVELWLV
jgi:hypothetical protein